jgi:hypothetical protein
MAPGVDPVPGCKGVNHIDFAIDGKYLIATCEFQGGLVKVDLVDRTVTGYLTLPRGRMPRTSRSRRTADVLRCRHDGGQRI